MKKKIQIVVISIFALFIIILNYYAFIGNSTSHTAFNIKIFFYLSLFILIATAVLEIISIYKNDKANLLNIIIIFILFFIVIELFVLNHFNILLYYEDWLKKGMPPKPF